MVQHGLRRWLAVAVASAVVIGCGATPTALAPTPTPTAAAPTGSPTPTPTASPSPSPSPSPSTSPSPAPTLPPVTLQHCPGRVAGARGGAVAFTSTNWSGYVASEGHVHEVTCVEGAWTEPVVTCPSSGETEVSIWVGMDGWSSDHLGDATAGPEQVGTDVTCDDGALFRDAWWETYPSLAHEVGFGDVIRPAAGDHMWAQVAYGTHGFTMTLADVTSQEMDAVTVQVRNAPRLTADWIVEAPGTACPRSTCPIVALAHFARLTFSGGEAVIAGGIGAIGDRHWARDEVTDASPGGTRRTTVSALAATGQVFSVTWRHT